MFRLSVTMGIPIGEFKERISDDELEWYLAFSVIEPFGALHDERRAMTGAIASLSPHIKKGKDLSLEDMSPYLDGCADMGTDKESKERARAAKAEATMRAFTMGHGWTKVEAGKE